MHQLSSGGAKPLLAAGLLQNLIKMTEQDIYQIAKAWIDKDHENSSVDWVKLMANDLARRIQYENQAYKECMEKFIAIEYWNEASKFLSAYDNGLADNLQKQVLRKTDVMGWRFVKDNEENLKAMPNDRDFEVLFDDGTILNFSDEDFPFAQIIAWREIACPITCRS
ncbi:MAG: hypothetical protein B6D44_09075 [Ignavibacteriales bacterium UTCHB2]|nr:MAG: hypothetical protein B6D44_09075 [Ignavibacteriales bacterium UTCHB2]